MVRLTVGFVLMLLAGALVFSNPHFLSHAQVPGPQRGGSGEPGGPRRGPEPGPGGPPPPPVLAALDKNGDGEISAAELAAAPEALKSLDRDDDGQIAGNELVPDFGPGRRGPGGRRGGGPGGFDPFAGGATERVEPKDLKFEDGVAAIPDHATYQKLSYRGEEVMIDTFLADLEFVKFTLDRADDAKERRLYFINTQTHRAHPMFGRIAGLPRGRGNEQMKGVLVYRPMLKSPSGKPGLYTFEFEPFDAYTHDMVKLCHDQLIAHMPSLEGNIGYYPRGERAMAQTEQDADLYEKHGPPVYQEEDLTNTSIAYLPLNVGSTFGRLRLMELDERPGSRDVVLYRSLPNELPRVAGIITAVRQTPLSHVNLRAVQDKLPNAFIANAADDERIKALLGKFVGYQVTQDGYTIREATAKEVESHFAELRPKEGQTLNCDLAAKQILPLEKLGFEDSARVGVKAANLAALAKMDLPSHVVPKGAAVPFYFYDEFMKHNKLYDHVTKILADPEFQENREVQDDQLKKLRALIKKGEIPDWMMAALDELHQSFPEGTSLRCRSSTNNEDLPGFSGAGLYDSFTHRPDEGHLSKTIKQVYASMWNLRAFEERDFYRIDHVSAAMGVLVHPNYKGELANGVAVTDDILYQTVGNYYVNTQAGEDLVTNPNEASIPEELLLDWYDAAKDQVMRNSNRAPKGATLLSTDQVEQLRKHLARIHARFAKLYGKSLDDPRFAMEIEFKITKGGQLAIKQARPWVYADAPVGQSR